MLPVRPIKVHNLLQKNYTYVWYQYDLSLADNRLVGDSNLGQQEEKN